MTLNNDQSASPELAVLRRSPSPDGIRSTTNTSTGSSKDGQETTRNKLEQSHADGQNAENRKSEAEDHISNASTDDEVSQVELEKGLPADIPIEALAGNGLVTNVLAAEDFDWGAPDEDDDNEKIKDDKQHSTRAGIVLCLNRNSSAIAWSFIFLFAIILIAVDVALFVVYQDRPSKVSYNLQLWFTWLAFMWSISIICQVVVELVPWAIKRLVGIVRPQSSEVLRMRLAYYMALRPFIKLLLVAVWAWGTWAFLQDQLPLYPLPPDTPPEVIAKEGGNQRYVQVFYMIWQCVFFAALLLFIEKFILQLIVTTFHKKAYGERIRDNDRALKILDRLKKVKRKPRQEHLLNRIRRKGAKNVESATGTPLRSNSADYGSDTPKTKSIMRPQDNEGTRANVHFPPRNIDTLIAIPPLDERDAPTDEKQPADPDVQPPHPHSQSSPQPPSFARLESSDFINNLTRRLKDIPKKKTPRPEQTGGSSPPQTDTPPPLSRTSTWVSWRTSEDKSFLGATRDFGISTTAIPGRLIKEAHKKLKSQTSTPQVNHDTTSRQAKALAKRIYQNITRLSGRESICEADLVPFFRTPAEAAEAFRLFDQDGSGDISKRELRSSCVRTYRERKNLTRSMRDLSQATGKLDIMFLAIFTVIWVVIVCASFGVDVGTQLLPLWSAFIAASFVFGSSAKDAFEAVIFVFVTHPFDAGDRIFVGPENWVVDNVGLLVSTFIKWDGSVVYVKNSVLAQQYIINCRRTGPTGETIEINIAFNTPSWKIRRLQDHMIEWTNEFPALYELNTSSSNVLTFENQNRITLSFYFVHTRNWQDMGGRWLRHNNFMMELKEECERLEISYVLPSQPLQSSQRPDAPAELYNIGSNRGGHAQQGMQVRRRTSMYDVDHHSTRGADG